MRSLSSVAAFALATLALSTSGTAFAHAKLLSSTPAANAKASNVKNLSLTFSDTVVDKLSGVEIVMTGMPGMANHDPMKVSGFKTALNADGKTMTITLPRALPVGSYKLDWHAVTADSHRIEGSYAFSVK
ncbi:copper homeostasis periplasmic binding protein CopC [Sphingobium sufflavum]|uniref:copper homeostasis periplasmic binding protein CopC n=1 Tax=Sphingobium sufflavum TaxID=1129547 RepID=UPI001F408F14|nr:copper homeostasis periplasmic binding protein CopC [Sphingobium sufflavum]MCE7796272.1 copper homeostasis periplasmic binding protein CopC [Sphingobium sufflavum]